MSTSEQGERIAALEARIELSHIEVLRKFDEMRESRKDLVDQLKGIMEVHAEEDLKNFTQLREWHKLHFLTDKAVIRIETILKVCGAILGSGITLMVIKYLAKPG